MSPAKYNLTYPIEIKVDPDKLNQDLKRMQERDWTAQDRYQNIDYWQGICVYSVSGESSDLRCSDTRVRKTQAGELCPYICNELLPQFRAPWMRVVFYRLPAGTKLGRHRDLGENRLVKGLVRVHVPVITNEKVLMYLDEQPYHMPTGTAWYFDTTAYHRVENNGPADRIHLLIDLRVTRELKTVLKPLSYRETLRLSVLGVAYYVEVVQTFCRLMWSDEGRERIMQRFKVITRRS